MNVTNSTSIIATPLINDHHPNEIRNNISIVSNSNNRQSNWFPPPPTDTQLKEMMNGTYIDREDSISNRSSNCKKNTMICCLNGVSAISGFILGGVMGYYASENKDYIQTSLNDLMKKFMIE